MNGKEATEWVKCSMWLVALVVIVVLAYKFVKGVQSVSAENIESFRKAWR